MANLKDKFTVDDISELTSKINHIFYQATHWETTSNAGLTELQLLNVIDQFCRISCMLCNMIEQQLEGNIDTNDPKGYIKEKLSSADNGIKNFLTVKKIDLY
ncbi:MAG: hypothetical protein ACXVHV_11150 [Methanobacterium sp.]